MEKPQWFKANKVLIINAQTCGINKDGHEQYIVNPDTGIRSNEKIDDALAECCEAVINGDNDRKEVFYASDKELLEKDVFVPKYYDNKTIEEFQNTISKHTDLSEISLGELIDMGFITITGGHGSPSADQRVGTIPYIKVSDLRAGHVNINPTNMVPEALAVKFWKANDSGLKPYDLISPSRASKNIGEFCVLMPGQERAVLTKEVLRIRATNTAHFDQFYLLWALSLKVVREQWNRVVLMQTNREDVGKRAYEIKIPLPKTKAAAEKYSLAFKIYFESLHKTQKDFLDSIKEGPFEHHIYWGE